jgi:hypothetical protein
MLATVLPVISFVLATLAAKPSPQAELADALASADSIDAVRADRARHTVTFAIERGGEAYEIVATTRASGAVVAVTIRARGVGTVEPGNLTWLADVMKDVAAVTRLSIDEDGAVTVVTSNGMRFMAIPGRGSGGNAAVEARWAAAWNDA